MYKSLFVLCVVYCVVIEARPNWQFLPPMPGYVPVYIRSGDTPLEEINLDLAEAFHELSAGRSAGKELEASPESPEALEEAEAPETPETLEAAEAPETPEQADQPQPEIIPAPVYEYVDSRPYEKKILEKKKKATSELPKPIERR